MQNGLKTYEELYNKLKSQVYLQADTFCKGKIVPIYTHLESFR